MFTRREFLAGGALLALAGLLAWWPVRRPARPGGERKPGVFPRVFPYVLAARPRRVLLPLIGG